jgi:hypothetical protein
MSKHKNNPHTKSLGQSFEEKWLKKIKKQVSCCFWPLWGHLGTPQDTQRLASGHDVFLMSELKDKPLPKSFIGIHIKTRKR